MADIRADVRLEAADGALIQDGSLTCAEADVSSIALLRSCLAGPHDWSRYDCYLRPEAEPIFVRVHDDEMLASLTQSLWSRIRRFVVVFRPTGAPSPNSSPRSFVADLSAAMTCLGLDTNLTDPFSLMKIREIPERDRVRIYNDKFLITVHADYIENFIKSQLAHGVGLFDIVAEATNATGSSVFVDLTAVVWITCLLRRHKSADQLLSLFAKVCESTMRRDINLKKLHGDVALFMRLKIFVHDLLNMQSDNSAMQRLNQSALLAPEHYFMSEIYFTNEQRQQLLNFHTSTGITFAEHMKMFVSSKLTGDDSESTVICGAHDLAPILLTVFGIRKGFQKEKLFSAAKSKFDKEYVKFTKTDIYGT